MKKKQDRIAFDMDGMTTIGKVRFRCRRVKYNGYEKFRLSANPPQEKRIDREFESEEQARSFFHRWQADNDPIGQGYRQTMTRLTQKQLQDATDAFDRLPEDSTLLELVKQYDLTKQTTLITLSDAWKEYRLFNIRTDENRDGSWVSKSTIIEQDFVFKTIIASLGSKIIKDICTEDLPNFWQSKKSDQTRLNHFKKIKSFFSWCVLKDYHFKDILALEKTPKVKRHALPQVLTLDQAKRLLEVSSRPKYQTLKPFVALCLFAGLRAGEIHAGWNKEDALKWEDFTLVPDGKEKPFLSLPFVGKMKSSRNVDLPPILVEILLKAKEDNLDVVPSKNGVNLWLRN